MAKDNEINYIKRVAEVDGVDEQAFRDYLSGKPFKDKQTWLYLIDLGQIFFLLGDPPKRVLDLGCGSGWTSEYIARMGFEVVGLDIAHDMIELAKQRVGPGMQLEFHAHDYEASLDFGQFDAAVIYDALHHADSEKLVIQRVFDSLKPGGVFITVEPGMGHSTSELSKMVREKYGTTEKDMDWSHQLALMQEVGFTQVRHYLRISQAPCCDMQEPDGVARQKSYLDGWCYNTIDQKGTSVVVGVK